MDRPPSVVSFATPSSLPATQGQRWRLRTGIISVHVRLADRRQLRRRNPMAHCPPRPAAATAAATSLLVPGLAGAAELNLAGIGRYAAREQLSAASQLSDLRPSDWAYQALTNLVERYGCVAGYAQAASRAAAPSAASRRQPCSTAVAIASASAPTACGGCFRSSRRN